MQEEENEFFYKIVKISNETQRVKSFELFPLDKKIFVPKAGMFIKIHYKDELGEFERSYSLASPPNWEKIELLIEMVNGRLTSKLEKAKVGDVLKISGPYGLGYEEGKKSLAIAGGVGVAPFIGIIRHIKEKGLRDNFILFYSARNKEDIIKKELFKELPKNIKVIITLTRISEEEQWEGERGRINKDMIKKYVDDVEERICYISGGLEMVKNFESILLELGVKKEKIRYDVWGA
ncbi:MAG: ferredoxin--NADP reductase [Candidatus Micrarchaeales archaeon]|jgi:NAD(P)H-flavin reductase